MRLKTLFLFTTIITFSLIPVTDSFFARVKRSKSFKIGEEILSHIIEAADTELINQKLLKGKTILMVFASAEQEFSKNALQDVQKMADKLNLKNFKAIGVVSSAKGYQEVQRLIKDYHLNYQVLYDDGGIISTQLRILVYPTTIIINSKGSLAYHYSLYASNYHNQLSDQLQEITRDKGENHFKEEILKRQQKEGIKKAREEIEQGKVKAAVTILTDLLQKGNNSYELHLLLGYSFINLKQPESALIHFKNAKEIQPDSTSVDLGMGIAYSRAGKVQSAATLLKKTINADPDSILAYRELSHIFEKKGNVDKALYYIKKELESLTHRIKE